MFTAPDIQNLKITVLDITNTSVTIQWLPPKFANGVVRYYHVHYYLNDTPQEQQQQDMNDISDEQQSINEQRQITVDDTKVNIYFYSIKSRFECVFILILFPSVV